MQKAALVGGIIYCAADESGTVARFESWQFACHWKINALAESVSFWRLIICRNKFRAVQNQIRAVQKQPSAVRCSNCISVKILICKVILVSYAVETACLAAVESCF
jgi:hypothetical protein